ncbi:MAG: NAD-dependent epimerase/dehydratase family protein, partial [Candidatus Omnitrophica bacterium]|nr:NAD-dependent epimerase/dehydratase family protein [Candidatus Omnitrophota bacterium]
PYAIAKISAIKLCRYYNEQYKTNFISVMPTNIYGKVDNFDLFSSHVIAALIRKFHLGKLLKENNWDLIREDLDKIPIESVSGMSAKEKILKILKKYGITKDYIEIWGSGEVYREFLYVDDLARASLFLMEKIDAEQLKKYCADYFVNIGTGKDIKIKDLAKIIKKIVGFDGKITYSRFRPEGVKRKLLDKNFWILGKIKRLGWVAKVNLEEGIKKTYNWYLSNLNVKKKK